MKPIPTKEQLLDALQTHKLFYKAAKSLHVSPPTLKKWMVHYGIYAYNNIKVEATQEAKPKQLPWYKRLFRI